MPATPPPITVTVGISNWLDSSCKSSSEIEVSGLNCLWADILELCQMTKLVVVTALQYVQPKNLASAILNIPLLIFNAECMNLDWDSSRPMMSLLGLTSQKF